MPLDYRTVKKQYDALYGAGVTRKPLAEWSAEMNDLTSSDLYNVGKDAGWWTRFSHAADENVFHPIASVTTTPLGGAIGSLFGEEEAGRRVGESLPRTLLETAPLYLAPGAGPVATLAKLASVAGLMGSHTYADTQSPAAAAISGVTGAALPLVGRFGGILGARAFGTTERVAAGDFATETATRFSPTQWLPKEGATRAFKAATFTGSQGAQAVAQEASMFATAKALDQPFDPLSADFLIGQIPFTVFDAVNLPRMKIPTAKAMEATRKVAEPERKPYVPPTSPIEEQAQLEKVFLDLQEVTLREDATPQEREAALATALGVAKDPKGAIGVKKATGVPSETPVNVTGWGKKVEGKGWKVVVDPSRTDASVPFEEHGNVWVNDENVTQNPDGSVTFKTPFAKINRKVTAPLKIEEVRRDPSQPDLPVQKNGLDPDEVRIFEKVGIKPAEVDPMLDPVQNPTGTMAAIEEIQRRNAPLKPIAQELEATQERLETAKEKIASVPKSAEEVAQFLVYENLRPSNPLKLKPAFRDINDRIESGYSHGDIVHLVSEDAVPGFVKPDGTFLTRDEAHQQTVQERIKQDLSSGLSPTQAVESARLTAHTPQVDAALEETNVLKRTAEKVQSEWKGKPQAQFGEAVRDETGKNFATKELADAYREADPELADFVVRNAGKDKGYYLARQINKEVSLEGTNLEAVLSERDALDTPIDARPDVSVDDVLGTLDRMGRRVDVADEILGNDDVGQTLKEIRFVREFIQKTRAGEKIVLDPEMQKVVQKVTLATGEWKREFRSFDMDSSVPHDEALVQQMGLGYTPLQNAKTDLARLGYEFSDDAGIYGLRKNGAPVDVNEQPQQVKDIYFEAASAALNKTFTQDSNALRNGLEWYINHPKAGPMGEFVGAMLKASDANGISLSDVELKYSPREGWAYFSGGRSTRARITFPKLPSSENDAFRWALQGAHEVAHHLGDAALNRADPQAVQFKATLTRVLTALQTSEHLPTKVKSAVALAKKEGWYDDYAESRIDSAELQARFKKAVGDENESLFPTFYGMQNEDELFAQMFSDHQFVELLAKTKVERGKLETLLDFFSKAWNRMFGSGKVDHDTALAQILTSFEDYLSGPKFAGRQKPILQVAGRKDTLLKQPQVNDILSSFAKGKPVTDAFSGSGQLATFLKEVGGTDVTLNVRDPKMRAVFEEVKTNTDNFAKRVAKAVEPIQSSREQSTPTMADGSSVKDYLDNLETTDPNVALLVKQNLNAHGREVVGGTFTPTKVISSVGLRELPNRIRSFAQRVDKISGLDGWEIVGAAKASDRITVDPPYVGGKFYTDTKALSVDEQLANYNKFLFPAVERGAKFVVFDIAEPLLVKALEAKGFTVREVKRTSRGGAETKTELVAFNHDDAVPPRRTINGYNGRDYLRDALIAKGVRPEGLASRLDTVEKLFGSGDLTHSLSGFMREAKNGLLPATAELPKKPFDETLLTLPPTETNAAIKNLLAEDVPAHQELWARMREDLTTAKELLLNIEKGYVPGTIPAGVKEKFEQAFVTLNAMKRGLDRQARDIGRWTDLQNFTTEGFEDTLAAQLTQRRLPAPPDPVPNADVAQGLLGLTDELADIRRTTAQAELQGKEVSPGLITRNLMLTQHVKKLFPAFRPVANVVRGEFASQFESNRTLNLAYAYDPVTQEFSKKVAKSNARVASVESLQKAASDIRRFANKWEAAGETWDFERPEVKAIMSKFNKTDQDALRLESNSGRARHHVWTEVILPQKLTQLNHANTAKLIASYEPGMLPDQAREISKGVHDAIAALQDPAQAPVGMEMLRELSTKVQPKTLQNAMKYSQEMVQQINGFLEFMRKRPSYSSEQRYDAHHLVMRGPDGQAFRVSRETKAELLKIQSDKERQGYTFLDYIPKSDANVPSSVREDVLNAMSELDMQSYNKMENLLTDADPVVKAQILSETLRTRQYRASADAFKPLPKVPRRFVEGREYIDMLKNEHEFYSRSVNWLRHRLTEAETSLDMLHPEVAGNRALKEFASQHVENSLTPDNPFFRKLTKAVYFQRLAFSFGNALLESTQNLGTGMQSLISETGSFTDAFALWGRAIKAIGQRGDKALSLGTKPEDLQWLRNRAEQQGLIRIKTFKDIHDPDSESATEINQLAKYPTGKAINRIQAGATKWATWFQRWNDEIGMYAGFMLGREKGMSLDEAYNFAWDIKERGTFTGGKAQRSVGLWSIKTKPVPQLLSSLQTYTLGWFSNMATDWKIGFRDMPGDFSATQRQGSRKAFVYGLAAQATLAGALGLPGMGQGLSLLKQATGLDLKGELRSTLASLFDEDTENGGTLTNLALRGGLAGVSPIDPSNRAAISFPFVGVDPYKGFDISSLLGATGSTVSDAVKGTLALMKGDWQGYQKMLPSVLRPPLQLLQGEGDVRDARGGLLQTLTPAERFVTAIGLPSSRIQAARDTAEAVKNLNEQASRERERLVDDLASTYRKLGPSLGQQKLVSYLQDHPQEDGAALVRAIALRVRRQTLPYDYRRDLNVAVDLKGLGSRMQSQELEGRKLEYDVQKNLGLTPRFNIRSDMRAMSIDQLMDSDPYLSRAAAVRKLEQTQPTRRRNSGLSLLEQQSPYR